MWQDSLCICLLGSERRNQKRPEGLEAEKRRFAYFKIHRFLFQEKKKNHSLKHRDK